MAQTSALAVRGLARSKASTNPDHGVQSLRTFLEKKASRKMLEHKLDGEILYISVNLSDASRFTHLNGFTFAGTTIEVEDLSQPANSSQSNSFGNRQGSASSRHPPREQRSQNNTLTLGGHQVSGPGRSTPTEPRQQRPHQNGFHSQDHQNNNHQNNPRNNPFNNGRQTPQNNRNISNPQFYQPGAHNHRRQDTASDLTPEIENVLISVLRKRYIPNDKYLNLESLALDPEIQASGLTRLPASKFFSLLFRVIETKVFETNDKRREMVTSVSLRNISLSTVQDIIGLAGLFPQLQNLDLSQNNISDTADLRYWRNRFRNLEHLILADNPIVSKPQTKDIMKRWYPKLRLYNNEPVRGAGIPTNPMDTTQSDTPPRTTSPSFTTLPTEPHPEFPPGSTFGVPGPGKSEEQLVKEQMGLKFSFETRLKMEYVEQCLIANQWDWDRAITNLNELYEAGQISSEAFIQV